MGVIVLCSDHQHNKAKQQRIKTSYGQKRKPVTSLCERITVTFMNLRNKKEVSKPNSPPLVIIKIKNNHGGICSM